MSTEPRYLVTGGCGFIGVNLVQRLVSVARGIRIFDNLTTGRKEDLDGFEAEIVPCDIRDEAAVDRVVDGVDVVIHLAAHTRVIDSIQDLRLNFEVNVLGTLNLLQAAVKHDVQRVIFASTGGLSWESSRRRCMKNWFQGRSHRTARVNLLARDTVGPFMVHTALPAFHCGSRMFTVLILGRRAAW